MNFFSRWFRRKQTPPPAPLVPSAGAAPVQPTPNDEKPIRVYDHYGRELAITREQWRTRVLPYSISQAWNNPDQLYSLITGAIRDGLTADVVPAARHLYNLEQSSRTVTLWSHLLIEQKKLDEAEEVCKKFLQTSGDDGYVITNVAKIYAARGNQQVAESVLWRALQVDPNQPFSVLWYKEMHEKIAGANGGAAALQRIAALPKSWRARLWIARAALDAGNLPAALAAYQHALANAETPPPAELLAQLTGDLGLHGHIDELLSLGAPLFQAAHHGLEVGNNLIKAHLDSGHITEARKILAQLSTIQRHDWKQTLAFWDSEIAKARIESIELSPAEPLSMDLVTIEGPIWITPSSPIRQLLPAKLPDPVRIVLLGCTAERKNNPKIITQQFSDLPGRLSRAAPLFLAEQLDLLTSAHAMTLIPRIRQPSPGFVLLGNAWTDDEASAHARQLAPPADYIATLHVSTVAEPARIDLRLIKTIDAQCIAQFSVSFPPEHPERGFSKLSQLLIALLAEHNIVDQQTSPGFYHPPVDGLLGNYLLRIEQLLAVRCAANEPPGSDTLSGVREIVEGTLHLTLFAPQNPTLRFLFAQTLSSLKHSHPEALADLREKVAALQKEYPLAAPYQALAQSLFDTAFSTDNP